MRKALFMLLVCILAVSGLSAGGQGEASGEKPVTLSLTYNWFGGDAHAPFIEWAVKDFQERYPHITLDLNEVPSNKLRGKVRADFMGGIATDIILWYGGAEAYDFVRGGWLMDISDVLAPMENEFIPGALENMTFNGKTYGLPLCQNFFALYLNKDIYAEYGFEYPETYEELKEQVARFKADGLIPIMVPGKNHPLIQHFYSYIANQTTPEGAFEEASYGEGTSFTDPGFKKAAGIIAELQDLGAFDENIDGIPMATVEDMFSKGEGAMYFAGIWRVGSLPAETREKMHPILFPVVEGFTENPNVATGQTEMGWVINASVKDDPAKLAAVNIWLEYFANPEISQKHVELTDTVVPVQKSVDLSSASYAVKESQKLVANAECRPFLRYYMSPAQGNTTNEVVWNLINDRMSAEEAVQAIEAVEANKR